jgi:ribonuclease G
MCRDILIDSATAETRVAVLENEQLAELFVERPSGGGLVGGICKGRVNTILPGMQSAFVDIGLERDAFLYVEDVALPGAADDLVPLSADTGAPSAGGEVPPAGPPPGGRETGIGEAPGPAPAPADRPRIEDLLKEGREILVQVARDPMPHKGARITCHLSLPGRFLVYLPGLGHVGVSRRIADPAERERLRAVVEVVLRELGAEGGCIVRTAGAGLGVEEFRADARDLLALWRRIRGRAASTAAPAVLHREPGLVPRVLRDLFGDHVQSVVVDGEAAHRETVDWVRRTHPEMVSRIRLWDGAAPLFAAHGLEAQIERTLRARVWLRSGGSIVIHPTEALVAIDVNTGKYVGHRHPEETILKTNLEAAAEIVRQVRLRDLGGIIVIDFIDMERPESRARVAAALEEELRKDRARSRMLQISEFGLVEITRQRSKPSLESVLCVPCARCHGSGRIKSPETLYFEVLRAIRALAPRAGSTVRVRAHPEVADFLAAGEEGMRLAGRGCRVRVWPDPALPHDRFAVDGEGPEPAATADRTDS